MPVKRKHLFLALVLLAGAVVLPAAGDLKVRRELEKRLQIKLEGKIMPGFFTPSFHVRDARFEWEDKVKLLSGDLIFDYDPAFLLGKESLRIRCRARNCQARLLGSWADMQGVGDLAITRLDADLTLDRSGLREVNAILVDSPAFQFHMEKTEKLTARPPAGKEPTT